MSKKLMLGVLAMASPLVGASNYIVQSAQYPLGPGALDVAGNSPAALWTARQEAHRYLEADGARGQLAYTQVGENGEISFQVVPYYLPSYLDWPILRTLASIWQQMRVLYRTFFGAPASAHVEPISQTLPRNDRPLTGRGALLQSDVIQRQRIFEGRHINVLYNYSPLRSGGRDVHFLLVPKPETPAGNFGELGAVQYEEVMELAQRINSWAREEFGRDIEVHFFDKTGKIAGQTQPVYHAHVIVVEQPEEARTGWYHLQMVWRMAWPHRPLPEAELNRRVTAFRNDLASALGQ